MYGFLGSESIFNSVCVLHNRPGSSPAHLCDSAVRGSPGEAAVFSPFTLLHPGPHFHLAALGQLQERGDTDASGDLPLTHLFI